MSIQIVCKGHKHSSIFSANGSRVLRVMATVYVSMAKQQWPKINELSAERLYFPMNFIGT